MEAESDLVIDAAPANFLKGLFDHLEGLRISGPFPETKHKEKIVGSRKLGRIAEPSVCLIKTLGKLFVGPVQHGTIKVSSLALFFQSLEGMGDAFS